MTRDLLISVNDLKKYGLVHDNIDSKLLSYCIWITQEMQVQEALGTELYKEMLRREAANDWNTAYTKLKDEYISKVLIAGVDYQYAVKGGNKFVNKGVGKISDENYQQNSINEGYELRKELLKTLEFFTSKLIGYLKDNCDLYEEYKNSNCDHEDSKQRQQKDFPYWG